MNINGLRQPRIMGVCLWLPVIITPIVYMVISFTSSPNYQPRGIWMVIEFMIPFIILFLIHHFILVRYLFMRNHYKTYALCAVLLLGTFGVYACFTAPPPKHRHPENKVADMRPDPPGPPPFERHNPERPHPEGPPNDKFHDKAIGRPPKGQKPFALDMAIAILLVGANLSTAVFQKYVKEQERNTDMEKKQLEQELEYLKSQLNPHFFMNTLNNIHGMVEISPATAQEMIMDLSQLMRYVLYEGARGRISLKHEIDFISSYITLLRKRYSEKKVSIDLHLPHHPDEGIMLPPLLFIVIIENAFKHGVSYVKHSRFDINLSVSDGNIKLVCRNTRPDNDKMTVATAGGIGMSNLRKRLHLLFGQNHTLKVDESDPGWYSVTLIIPYNYETDTMFGNR
ncbi:MAG: sensor histidine kinase [Bacteroidales bacterium]|nr:sensor histidine kinase [Bacteroidales bacterium]